MSSGHFDLALSFPQWQGSGRSTHLPRGGQAAAEVIARYAPLQRVPITAGSEPLEGINNWAAILEQFRAAQSVLNATRPCRVLAAGGDCAVDVPIVDYLLRQYPELTLIWVDAHLDSNTTATTPSGNFHGMPVAALLGSAPARLAALLGKPLAPAQFRYASAHVGDKGDWDFQKANELRWWDPQEVLSGPVHIHFDLDALDPRGFPYVAYPDGRMPMAEGVDLIRTIARGADLVGLTITEFAPATDSDAVAGSVYLRQLCEAAHASSTAPARRCRT